ncbi:MAG TPA: hypothetical protein PKM87_04480 [Methanolinea sp.]|nr:hypothetical protein [Methanolinea sp.]
MKKNAICVLALLLAAILIVAPAAAGIYSPQKVSPPQFSSQRSFLAGVDINNPASFQSFMATVRGMDLSPSSQPNPVLPAYLGTGVTYQNLFSSGCAGCNCCGCCGCC